MIARLFIGSKLKVKRANQHIHELQRVLTAFLGTDFYRLSVEKDPISGQHILKFQVTEEMPCEVPLIIGDAVHNLRAALDLMTCEIVTSVGAIPDKSTQFIVSDSRDKLVKAINSSKIKTAPQTIIDLIIDRIKPYRGGNDTLYALHSLDIMDKHRLLIPVISVSALVNVKAEDDRHNVFQFARVAVGQGGKLNIVRNSDNIDITNQGQPALAVILGKGTGFAGKPVIPTLHQLSQLVSGILQAVEQASLPLS
jgi:hypothetical protein